jgi:hypothetical protein
MYQIIKEHAFFCNGKSYNQLIGVEESRETAIEKLARLVIKEPSLKNLSILILEITTRSSLNDPHYTKTCHYV